MIELAGASEYVNGSTRDTASQEISLLYGMLSSVHVYLMNKSRETMMLTYNRSRRARKAANFIARDTVLCRWHEHPFAGSSLPSNKGSMESIEVFIILEDCEIRFLEL